MSLLNDVLDGYCLSVYSKLTTQSLARDCFGKTSTQLLVVNPQFACKKKVAFRYESHNDSTGTRAIWMLPCQELLVGSAVCEVVLRKWKNPVLGSDNGGIVPTFEQSGLNPPCSRSCPDEFCQVFKLRCPDATCPVDDREFSHWGADVGKALDLSWL